MRISATGADNRRIIWSFPFISSCAFKYTCPMSKVIISRSSAAARAARMRIVWMEGVGDVSVSSHRSSSFWRFPKTTRRDLIFSDTPDGVRFSYTITFSRRIFFFWVFDNYLHWTPSHTSLSIILSSSASIDLSAFSPYTSRPFLDVRTLLNTLLSTSATQTPRKSSVDLTSVSDRTSATLNELTDDFLDVCVAEVDSKVLNKVLTLRSS